MPPTTQYISARRTRSKSYFLHQGSFWSIPHYQFDLLQRYMKAHGEIPDLAEYKVRKLATRPNRGRIWVLSSLLPKRPSAAPHPTALDLPERTK